MTIKEIIKNENYDYIDIRITLPKGWKEESIFAGCCKSENGKLIPLDGDTYDVNQEVISSERWKNEKRGVENGLTVVLKGKCM